MSGIAAYLQTELVALSNEARRKYPEIKEAAERVIALLRHPHQGINLATVLSQNQDVLKPFLLACDTKNVKLVTISMGCLRELISHRAMPEGAVEVVLKSLNDIMGQGVEIQLKILQTILPLLTNYSVNGEPLAEALLLCFRLQDSRVVFVNNTAAATLRQLVIYIFDKVGDEDRVGAINLPEASSTPSKETDHQDHLQPCAQDAYMLFQDLCLLTNAEQARFLKLGTISRTFGLELIESVLTNHFHLFKEHPEFASLLRERVCPLIIKNFSDKHDFPQTMRLMRVVYILIKQFHEILTIECEIFLSMLIKLLEPEGNIIWQRVLAMEIFRGICGDGPLLRKMFSAYDLQNTSTDIFGDMIAAIGRLSTEKPQLIGAGGFLSEGADLARPTNSHAGDNSDGNTGGLSLASSTMRIQCVDQLDKADPPQIPDTYLYYLSMVCINSIADGLAAFIFPIVSQAMHEKQLEAASSNPESPALAITFPDAQTLDLKSHRDAEEITLVTTMAESAWPGLLAAFSFFLGANLEEELFHNVMRSYQNFTSVCGVLQLMIPRDAFLTSLCKNCLPILPAFEQRSTPAQASSNVPGQDSVSPNITDKNMYCLRILLNVAQYLGGSLYDSWYLILETMQQADHLLATKLLRASSSQVSRKQPATFNRVGTQGGPHSPNSSATTPGRPGPSATELASDSGLFSGHQEPEVMGILALFRQLFDYTANLDISSLLCFSRALCKLGAAGCGIPVPDGRGGTKTPFLKGLKHLGKADNKSFAIEKLRYVCLLNVDRLAAVEEGESVWGISTKFLIDTANHPVPSIPIRIQACNAIADIILSAMSNSEQHSADRQQEAQMRVLMNLRELTLGHSNALVEIQRLGLETLHKLLRNSGQSISFGWSTIFDMIQSATRSKASSSDQLLTEHRPSEDSASGPQISSTTKAGGLVRIAFPCLQLICTDFLSLLDAHNLQLCIDSLASFGQQTEDLNIALTSVGLLWNVSDFIQQHMRGTEIVPEDSASAIITSKVPSDAPSSGRNDVSEIVLLFEDSSLTAEVLGGLWMLLLFRMSTMCSDARPEVRNGAIQTLLRTVQLNAANLKQGEWRQCVWRILLPLLDAVVNASSGAAEIVHDRPSASTGLYVVRSDSPSKQWDETKVLLFNGLADIFQNFLIKLCTLSDFQFAWKMLLEHYESACLFSSPDVAVAALKGIQTITKSPAIQEKSDGERCGLPAEQAAQKLETLWDMSWKIWERLGSSMVDREPTVGVARKEFQTGGRTKTTSFTQETLTEYVLILQNLYPLISKRFQLQDLQAYLQVLHLVLIYNKSPIYRVDVDYMSPLQLAVHDATTILSLELDGGPAALLTELTLHFLLAFEPPAPPAPPPTIVALPMPPPIRPTYIALCKVTVTRIVFLLDKFQRDKSIYADGVYAKIIRALALPMRLRYKCPPSFKHVEDIPLWKMATGAFLDATKTGISTMEALGKSISDREYLNVWQELIVVCRGTMAPTLPMSTSQMSLKDQALDESFDLVYLQNLEAKVFSRMGFHRVPADIVQELIQVLDQAANLYIMSSRSQGGTTSTVKDKSDQQLDVVKDLGIMLHATTGTMVPVGRERFAFACLEILFDLCATSSASGGVGMAAADTKTAKVAAPVLMRRCQGLLEAYSADQTLLGKCPFPRLRHQEISLILRRLADLRLAPGVLCSQTSQSDTSAQKVSIKDTMLAGPTAHLFYLYEALTDAMFCHDPEVLLLLKTCLKNAGRSIGIHP